MILFVAAMEEECTLLIEKGHFIKKNHSAKYNLELYEHQYFLLLITGIGLVNAACNLNYLLNKYQISLIINIGTCGTSNHDLLIGEMVYINQAKYLFADTTSFGYEIGQVPKEKAVFNCDQGWTKKIANFLKAKSYDIASSDVFCSKKWHFAHIKKYFHTISLFDMELTAILQVADKYHLPVVACKWVSDYIVHPAPEHQFKKNIAEIKNKILKAGLLIMKECQE